MSVTTIKKYNEYHATGRETTLEHKLTTEFKLKILSTKGQRKTSQLMLEL